MFMLRLRSLVREEVSASRRDPMALSNLQLALAVRVPRRDRQVTAQYEVVVRDFTVVTPRVPYHAPWPPRRIGRRQPVRFECALTRRSYDVRCSRNGCATLSGASHHSLLQFIERA